MKLVELTEFLIKNIVSDPDMVSVKQIAEDDEYITIEGEKLSKSKGNYITLRHLLNNYPVDSIRYYFSINCCC